MIPSTGDISPALPVPERSRRPCGNHPCRPILVDTKSSLRVVCGASFVSTPRSLGDRSRGSLETHAESHPARRKDPRIFSSRSTDRHCRRDRAAAGQGHPGRRSRRPAGGGRRAAARRRPNLAAADHQQRPPGPGPAAPFVRPRDGPGGDAAVRRRAVGLWADGGRRLLLRFSDGARPLARPTSPRSRPRWPGSSRKTSRSSGSRWIAHEAIEFCRDLGQSLKVEHLEEGLADEATVSFYRQGEFIDLCRGPHVPSAGRHRRVQAAVGGRGLLEGRRLAPAVAAALRHGLLQPSRNSTTICARWKRPSAATTACWASSSNCS